MKANDFIFYIEKTLDFLGLIMNKLWSFLTTHIWLLSMVLAPLIVYMIIFGVQIAFSFVTRKKDDRKGER